LFLGEPFCAAGPGRDRLLQREEEQSKYSPWSYRRYGAFQKGEVASTVRCCRHYRWRTRPGPWVGELREVIDDLGRRKK